MSSVPRIFRVASLQASFAARMGTAMLTLGAIALLAGCKPVGPKYNKPGFTAPDTYKETGAPTVVPPPNPLNGSWKLKWTTARES